MRAVQITEFGGPEVLTLTDLPDPEAGDRQVVIDVTSAGVNYADTHQVEDSYLAKQQLPMIPGGEVVGIAPDGRRVVTFTAGNGGYATKAIAPAAGLAPVPDGVEDGAALALLVQGLTAWHLLKTSAPLKGGETVVVHAAAGGVGSLAVQLAKRLGAGKVVGGASSDEKRALATELGCDATFDSRADDPKAAIEEAAGGKVDVVLDMVGGTWTDGSIAALAPFGRLVHYGMASREEPSRIEAPKLMYRSRSVTGFWLMDCMADPRNMIAAPLGEMLGLVASGELSPVVHPPYPLSEARRAHEDMRNRVTSGKVVLDCTA